jgi:TonB family protein
MSTACQRPVYGAAELFKQSRKYMSLALAIAACIHLAVSGGFWFVCVSQKAEAPARTISIALYDKYTSPSSLKDGSAGSINPSLSIKKPARKLISGIPVPVPFHDPDSIFVPQPQLSLIDIGTDSEFAGPGGLGRGTGGPGGTGEGLGSGPPGQAHIRQPELLMLVPPVYPREAEKKRIEGAVELRIHITTDGVVDQVEVQKSSGFASMDEASVTAAIKTRFRPAFDGAERLPMWIDYPIRFSLNKAP